MSKWREWLKLPAKGIFKSQVIKDKSRDLTKERDDVLLPIARALFARLGDRADLLMGLASEQEMMDYYNEVYVTDVLPLILNDKIKFSYIEPLFGFMMQAVSELKNRTAMNLNHRLDQAVTGLLGTDQLEMSVQELESILQELGKINSPKKAE